MFRLEGLRAWLRLLRLAWHVLVGALTVAFLFPRLDHGEQGRRLTRWSAEMLQLFGISLVVRGRTPPLRGKGVLIVANHVSWLDIHLLHSLLPCRFVAKADIARWPLFGWLAAQTGTLFLVREKRSAIREMNVTMASLLAEGECLTLFPEGTTTSGDRVLPFRGALLEPVIQANATLCPVSIRYLDGQGQRTEIPAYHGEMTLMESLWRIACAPPFTAQIEFMPALAAGSCDRRSLAARAEGQIRASLEKGSSAGHSSVTFAAYDTTG
ncbi:MAG: 1-acyl-sn-glycerol-3-phosphate acyltransferase [Betaproteobacteria bacterium]|nr:1-acyl-sn-glycerol-3-phosphate acyltransferase [Betaproteobacteria bacterium]